MSVLPFSAGSGEGAQDSCRRAQAKSSPGVLASSSSLPSSAVAQSALPSGQQRHQLQVNLAQLKKWKASCTDQETKQWLDTRISELQFATLPWEVHGSADRVRQGGGEEDPRQHGAHVSPCFRGLRKDRGSQRPQSCRQGNHFPSPDKVAHRVCSARVKPSFSCFSRVALATGMGFADEATRSSDLFSAIRRVVFPDLTPSRSSFLVQMEMETPQFKRPPPSDHEISDVEQLDTETEAEQLGEAHAHPSREFVVGPFSQEGAKETKELIILSSLIPDCRPTVGALSREFSLYDPRNLLSFQVAAHRGTPADLWEAFCSLPKAHDHHLVHHALVFTDGSVDFDEAQSSSPLPPSALSAGFSGVVFVFLGAFWSPLFQQFSHCKSPSASQAELAAVAGTLKLFGNTLARHRVGLTIHADCQFAISLFF